MAWEKTPRLWEKTPKLWEKSPTVWEKSPTIQNFRGKIFADIHSNREACLAACLPNNCYSVQIYLITLAKDARLTPN